VGALSLTRSKIIGIAIAAYIAIVVIMSFRFKIALTPDRLILLLLIAGLATGRVREFLKDWSIFLIVLLAWQVLTGMSHTIGHGIKPHVTEMISVDRFLFGGHVPTIWLQHHFYHPGHVNAFDIAATVFYTLHFAFPIVFAFVLWVKVRPVFVEFMTVFLILGLAGFATFVLYPAAPPWIAADWYHRLPYVYRIYHAGMEYFGGTQSFSAVFHWMWKHQAWDYFGAVPSEHAAFPFLCFLFARQVWKRAGWFLLLYCLGVWVSVVYLGEHYVTDVIVGVAYAGLSYAGYRFFLAQTRKRGQTRPSRVAAAPVSDSYSL
jgi:membrane-associated phospholipid phosphatase